LNISFLNILLNLINIHLQKMSEICYLQLLECFLAYFYPHLDHYYLPYSAVLHNQVHLHPHSSIPLLFDWFELHEQIQLFLLLVPLLTVPLLSVVVTVSFSPVFVFLSLLLWFANDQEVDFVEQVDVSISQVWHHQGFVEHVQKLSGI